MILYQYSLSLTVVLALRTGDTPARKRVVEALRTQTLSKRHWRLVVIEEQTGNRSSDLAEQLVWHPRTTIVHGSPNGSAPGAIRAMLASRSDLVLFIDGRTVLAPDYLENSLRLAEDNPFVGIFGGTTTIAADCPKPRWQRNFIRFFGIREVRKESIFQETERRFMPGPSGYMVRKEHLRRFSHVLRRHPFFQESQFLRQMGDFDFRAALARTIVQAGFSMGLFPHLRAERVTCSQDFSERTIRECLRRDAFSRVIERFVWTGMLPDAPLPKRWEKLALRWMQAWQWGRQSRLRASHRAGVVAAYTLAAAHYNRPVPVKIPADAPRARNASEAVA